jgi:hypothetical protein
VGSLFRKRFQLEGRGSFFENKSAMWGGIFFRKCSLAKGGDFFRKSLRTAGGDLFSKKIHSVGGGFFSKIFSNCIVKGAFFLAGVQLAIGGGPFPSSEVVLFGVYSLHTG